MNKPMTTYHGATAIHGRHPQVGPPLIRAMATPLRRNANYQPSIWSYEYIQSLTMDYGDGKYERRCGKLKECVRTFMEKEKNVCTQVELIDSLHQLGVAYHFDKEIEETMSSIHSSIDEVVGEMDNDLHAISQLTRVLRSNGFDTSTDVFSCFMEEKGGFRPSLCNDYKGMLSLYEASFHGMVGEDTMDKAREFTTHHLNQLLYGGKLHKNFEKHVAYALELPIHWRNQRLHARWYIDAYKHMDGMNPILLELAKIDFNVLQNLYKDELKSLSRWWNNLHLIGEKTSFARDRMVEIYFWAVGWISEPQYKRCRAALTKINSIITLIDDVYDVYATLEELQTFTEAINRWDINEAEKLPEYMKICFFATFNTTNDIGYEVFRHKGVDIIPSLKIAVAATCNCYLQEAKWYHSCYTPLFEEYMNNGWVSIAGLLTLTFAYCTSEKITTQAIQDYQFYSDQARTSYTIFRLMDDLGTSPMELARGDVQKALQCYMHEKGVSEVMAREEINRMKMENWKIINGYCIPKSIEMDTYRSLLLNIPRMAQCMYQHGDGFAEPHRETKDRILSLLVHPVPL